MAGIKQRGPQSVNNKRTRMRDGELIEIKPVRWVRFGGSSIMAGCWADTGDMVVDENGKVIPFQSI